MPTHEDKLRYLLSLLWKSPVFGDSFPPNLNQDRLIEQFQAMKPEFYRQVFPILRAGMPEASEAQVNEIIAQIGPKSLAFCAATAAGEITDTQRLLLATIAIALSYWADQSMDRGDTWMLAAVKYLNEQEVNHDTLSAPLFQARLHALKNIELIVTEVNPSDSIAPFVLRAIQHDVLANQARMCVLGQSISKNDAHITNFDEEIADTLIGCSGLMSATTAVYATYDIVYDLPDLQEIYTHPYLGRLINETFNPAVRIFDDVGDCFADSGQDPAWGMFNINIVNQNHPRLVEAFLRHSGLTPSDPRYYQALECFALPLQERRLALARFYRNLCRQRLQELPASLWERYRLFLTLAKRTLEAAFVNMFGDVFLAENTPFTLLDEELLSLFEEVKL